MGEEGKGRGREGQTVREGGKERGRDMHTCEGQRKEMREKERGREMETTIPHICMYTDTPPPHTTQTMRVMSNNTASKSPGPAV